MLKKMCGALKLLLVVALVMPAMLQAGPAASADSGWSTNLGGWTKKEGDDWTDEAGGKRIASPGKNTLMLAEGTWTHFEYEADVTFRSMSGHMSLLFRADASGWGSYKLQVEPSLNEIRLTGADPLYHRYTPATALTTDSLYRLKVVAAGSSIKVYWGSEETLIFDVENNARAAGHLGLLVWDGDVLLQNVNAVERVPAEPTFLTNLTGWSYSGDTGAHVEAEDGLLLSSDGNYLALAETAAANFDYEGEVKLASGSGLASLVFRANANGWGSYMVQLDPAAGKLRLLNANDQAPTRLFEERDIAIEPNTVYRVRVKAEGEQLHVYWNGASEPVISANDDAYGSGRLGLHIYNGSAVFQNVQLKELGAAYPPVSANLSGWSPRDSGTMEETAAGLKLASTGNYFAMSDRTADDLVFEADIAFASAEGVASLLLRSNDNGWESYMVQIARHGASPGTATLRLVNANDAAPSRLYREAEVALAPDGVNHVKAEAIGTELRVYWNGAAEPVLHASDGAYASGKLGLHVYNADATFQHIYMHEPGRTFSGLRSNLEGWQLRELGDASAGADGLTLRSEHHAAAVAATSGSDIEYEADVTIASAGAAAALLLRADNSGRSGYMVQADHKGQKLRLVSLNGAGGSELLAEAAAEIAVGRTYRLRVKAEGDALRVYWNGRYDPLLQAASATHAEGRLGLHGFGGEVRFQNVNIGELATNVTGWRTAGGSWHPNVQGVQGKSGSGPGAWSLRLGNASQPAAHGDLVLEGDLVLDPATPDAAAALLLRGSADGARGYLVALRPDGSVALLKKDGADVTVAAASSIIPLAAGKPHHVEIVAEGSALTVYVDGYSTPAIESNELEEEFGGTAVGLAVTEGSAYFNNVYATALNDYYNELYRPQYHYTPARGAASDPNGLVYLQGEYHLFHQDGGQWAHAISTDLLHWKRMPIALKWNELGHIWSGSAVADTTNASGLFTDSGGQGLIAYYTSFHPDKPGGNQKVGMAYSKDKGRTWQYYGDEAIVPNPGGADGGWDFRDPKVVRDEANNRWVMVVSGGDNIHFLTSTNLINWQRTDQFGFNEIAVDGEWQEGVWECPDFFPLTVEGGTARKWVLMISTGANPKTQGSESRYFIGEFTADGKFVNDNPVRTMLKIEYGKEMYASMSFDNVPDGRRIMMAWMSNWDYPFSFPTSPWKGTLTIPRELYLVDTPDGIRLAQRPVRELESLRGEPLTWSGVTVTPSAPNLLSGFSGSAYEIEAELALPETGAASEFGFRVREGGEQATVIGYRSDEGRLFVDRSAAGRDDFSDKFTKLHEASVQPFDGRIRLRILVDESSVEVFANGGLQSFTELVFPDGARDGLAFYAVGGAVEIVSLNVYPLANVWRAAATSGETASGIRIDRPSYELGVGEERRVYASVVPYTAANKELRWETADPAVAQVTQAADGSAVVRAVAQGSTTITVRTADGAAERAFSVTVGSFVSNLEGWKSYPNSEWVPTALGIRGFYGSDAAYMSSRQAANFTYEADVTMTERGAGSILFRANADGTAGYYFNIDPNMRAIRLFYKAPGKGDVEDRMVLARVAQTIEIGRTYHVKIVAEGMSIKIYWDGEPIIDVLDDTYHQGYFGLNVFDGYVYYQNVAVRGDTPIDTRQYRIASAMNGLVMSVDSQDNFARLKGSVSSGSDNEKWILVPLAQGGYTVRTAATGKALDWDTGQNRIQLYPYIGYYNQRWLFVAHEDGTYTIVSRRDQNQALQLNAEGGIALADRDDAAVGQRWRLQEIVPPAGPGSGNGGGSGGGDGGGVGGGVGDGSSGGDSSGGTASDAAELRIDGELADYAIVRRVEENGGALTEVVLDGRQLAGAIAGRGAVQLGIEVKAQGAVRIGGLTHADLKLLAALKAEISVHTSWGIVVVRPASMKLDTASDADEIMMELREADRFLVARAVEKADLGGYKLLSEPLAAELSGVHGDARGSLRFAQYTPVMLALPEGWDRRSAVTVVAVQEDGSASHLPTIVTEVNGKLYALAQERTRLRTYALAAGLPAFPDTANHWAGDIARSMGERFIMNGDGQGGFRPDDPITRSQFAAIAVRGLGLVEPAAGDSGFADIPADRWDSGSIQIAKEYGIVNGFADGTFRGGEALTREQAMVAVYRAMLLMKGGQAVPLAERQKSEALSGFKDAAQLSGWAIEAAAYLVYHGIVDGNGRGELKPGDSLTRAQAAAMLYRLLLSNGFIE